MRLGLSMQSPAKWGLLLYLLLQYAYTITAVDLDLSDNESVKTAAKKVAKGLTDFYTGDEPGDTPGNLPDPYYWWEAGAMFGALIDYWYYTDDDQYNDITIEAMLHQVSPTRNFMPLNQTMTEGNDDQAFWGFAAMSAAERNFPNPPKDKPQWLAMAQGVFNSQAERWNMETCGGGLKWQIFRWNRGFEYKNTISNGGFFNIAARLALYTRNETYAEWAEKTWDWSKAIGLIGDRYEMFDGSDDTKNCSEVNRIRWTYNAGVMLHGAANMYNYTDGSEIWKTRVQGIIDSLGIFFHKDTNIMYESSCEPINNCETDQRSFKAYLARWLAATTQVAPFTTDKIMPKLKASAMAAAKTCTGDPGGSICGLSWTKGKWDNSHGVGEQMAGLEIIQSNLVPTVDPPVSDDNGGTSKGDPNAGSKGDGDEEPPPPLPPIKTADRAGAGILTILFIGFCGAGVSMFFID